MKNNLGSILTALDKPDESQLRIIRNWVPAAAMTYVLSKPEIKNEIGISWQKSYKPRPLFKDAIVNHMGRIRGFESIGLASPDIAIKPDFSTMFDKVSTLRLQTAWAFRFEIDKIPRFFVINTFILPHMLPNLTDSVFFDGVEWQEWMHKWLVKTMLPHRYVDVTNLGNVTEAIEKPKPEPVKAPEVVVETKTEPFDDDVSVLTAPEPQKPAKAPEPTRGKKLFAW